MNLFKKKDVVKEVEEVQSSSEFIDIPLIDEEPDTSADIAEEEFETLLDSEEDTEEIPVEGTEIEDDLTETDEILEVETHDNELIDIPALEEKEAVEMTESPSEMVEDLGYSRAISRECYSN